MSLDISNLKDVSIGKMIDYTIEIYKKNFKILTLITLILYIPMVILVEILSENVFSLRDIVIGIQNGDADWISKYNSNQMTSTQILIGVGLYFLSILYTFSAEIVLHISIILILYKTIKNTSIPKLGKLVKESLKKFWSVVLSNIISGAVIMGVFVVLSGFFVVALIIFAAVGSQSFFNYADKNTTMVIGIIVILAGILLTVVFLSAIAYFWIKFLFVPYSIVIENENITNGISRSFKLTKKHLNKIGFGYTFAGLLYFIVTKSIVVTLEIINVFDFELFNVVYSGIMRPLLSIVGSIFYPFLILFLGVVFISLKVKKEAYDLEVKVDKLIENTEIEKSNG